MISSNLIQTVRAYGREFDVEAIWLFGSAMEDEGAAEDYDLAVEGLAPERFWEFYGRLFFDLPKPVDLVDLSQNPPIAAIVRSKGVCLYER